MSASSQPESSEDGATVNITALLLSMLGPTRANISHGPAAAPVGIVMAMDVALHELTVSATDVVALLSTTPLAPCVAPKPEPEITTCVPAGPVVVDRLVITGGVTVLDVIDTLSKYWVTGLLA